MKEIFKKYLNERRPKGQARGHEFLETIINNEFIPWCKENGISFKVIKHKRHLLTRW